ncbi:hypothetical protein AGMMS49942_21600 [Spirochaetia bacterium]|nr:hypothetical protein AGMMS49942_21600 [Spirochaetia bacterium]
MKKRIVLVLLIIVELISIILLSLPQMRLMLIYTAEYFLGRAINHPIWDQLLSSHIDILVRVFIISILFIAFYELSKKNKFKKIISLFTKNIYTMLWLEDLDNNLTKPYSRKTFNTFFIIGMFALLYFYFKPYQVAYPYEDDLFIADYAGMSAHEFLTGTFTNVTYKFRPVSGFILWVYANLFMFNMRGYFLANLFFHSIMALYIYTIASSIIKNRWIGVMFPILYAFSSFSLYHISQAMGPFELLGLIFEISILFVIYQIMTCENDEITNKSILCIVLYFIIMYVHERFMVLILPISIMFIYNRKKYKSLLLFTIFLLIPFFFLITKLLLEKFIFKLTILMGTGGYVMHFSIIQPIRHFLYSIGYLFGIHPLEFAYLDGISRENVNLLIFIVVIISTLCFILIFFNYIRLNVLSKLNKPSNKNLFYCVVIYLISIICMITSSSFTIRVEQRWIYNPYVALLFILMIMLKYFREKSAEYKGAHGKWAILMCFLLYSLGNITYSYYYHCHWNNVYILSDWNNRVKIFYKTFVLDYPDRKFTRPVYYLTPEKFFVRRKAFSLVNWESWKNVNFIPISLDVFSADMDENHLLVYYKSNKQEFKFANYSDIGNTARTGILGTGVSDFFDDSYSIVENKGSILIRSGKEGIVYLEGFVPDFNIPNMLSLYFNDVFIEDIIISDSFFKIEIDGIPKNIIGVLTLQIEKAAIPFEVGAGEDRRRIGVCITDIIMK